MKFLKYGFIVSQAIIFSYGISFALNVCPGEVRSVSWSSTGATTCNVSVTSSSFGCRLDNSNCAGGPVGVTAPTSGSCTASMTGSNGGAPVTAEDVLNVVDGSHCCNVGTHLASGEPYWDIAQNKCTPYTTPWCQDGSKHGGARYDYITNGVSGWCGCTSPRTDIGGSTGCACPFGTNWNGVLGAGATCTANACTNGAVDTVAHGCNCFSPNTWNGSTCVAPVATSCSGSTPCGSPGSCYAKSGCDNQCGSTRINDCAGTCGGTATDYNGATAGCGSAGANPACVLSASPSTITSGQSSTLSATVSGVYPNGLNPVAVINSGNGTVVSPTVTTTYYAVTDDTWGWMSSQHASDGNCSVTVNVAATTPGACDKTASRNETNYGDASHQPLCVGGNTYLSNLVGPTGTGPTYTYTWNCLSPNGGTTASCSTSASCTNGATGSGNFPTCTPLAAPTAWISASPLSVANGVGTTLSWGSSNTTYCERSGVLQNGYTSGTAIGTSNAGILTSPLISASTKFDLRCMGTDYNLDLSIWV